MSNPSQLQNKITGDKPKVGEIGASATLAPLLAGLAFFFSADL